MRNGEVEKAVITINWEIRQLSEEKGFEVTDINIAVRGVGRVFQRDGIRFDESTSGMASGVPCGRFLGAPGTPGRRVVRSEEVNLIISDTRISYMKIPGSKKGAKWLEKEQQLKDDDIGVCAVYELNLRDIEHPSLFDDYIWERVNKRTEKKGKGGVSSCTKK